MPVAAWAQQPDHRFYIAPMFSFGQFDDDGFEFEQPPVPAVQGEFDLDDQSGYTIAIGKPLSDLNFMNVVIGMNLELYGFGFSGVENKAFDGSEADVNGYGASLLVLPIRNIFPVFVLAGVGFGEYQFDGTINGNELDDGDSKFYDLGIGAMIPIPYIDFDYGIQLRVEYRYRNADVDVDGASNLTFRNNIASIGLYIPLGAPPAEPKPEPVAPPPPQDSDGDGVVDSSDQCPDTPAGTQVNSKGCAIDADNDGVIDSADKCPGTPPGTEVNSEGCPAEKEAPIVLKGVTFEFNSAQLTSEAENRLDNVVNALKTAPDIHVLLAGHTDSIGTNSYNLDLSQRRVDSVKRYLVEHGIDPSRLTTKGYGESQPVAPNTTAAGRAQNRRVEVHVTNQ
ncbi:MAG: OmpA family protein [Salinisphaera sp.]|nr:OmpA family protein [Salinisphaera sp.]